MTQDNVRPLIDTPGYDLRNFIQNPAYNGKEEVLR